MFLNDSRRSLIQEMVNKGQRLSALTTGPGRGSCVGRWHDACGELLLKVCPVVE